MPNIIYLLPNLIKEELKGLYWLKILIVFDVLATTVAFLSKDKKCTCLTASCGVISRKRIPQCNKLLVPRAFRRTLEAVNALVQARQCYVFVCLFYLARNAMLQEIVFVATLVTCQQFPHSPNLFHGCINEHIALPSVYKNINSFQRHQECSRGQQLVPLRNSFFKILPHRTPLNICIFYPC